jgi:hypothetical protein
MLACTKEKREAWLDEAATSSDHVATESGWTKLWQIRVPAKLRIFLWRLAKQSLPTADVLHHRNIAPASLCAICGAENSWRHSLLDFTMTRCLWALSHAERVNDIVGHTTCLVCALKSHILQTRLTGQTTCETRALEVTNRSVVRFFVKNQLCWACEVSWILFLHLTPWPKIMWYNFILLIFFRVNCKKTSSNQDFFS